MLILVSKCVDLTIFKDADSLLPPLRVTLNWKFKILLTSPFSQLKALQISEKTL